jgi:hypothetical protein
MQLSWDTASRETSTVSNSRLLAYDTRGADVGDFGFDNVKEYDVSQMIKKWSPDYVTTVGDNESTRGRRGWSRYDRVVGKYYNATSAIIRALRRGRGIDQSIFPRHGKS